MVLKKIHFPIYILAFALLFVIQSCEKKKQNNTRKKRYLAEIERLSAIADQFHDSKKFDSSFYYYNKIKTICDPKTDPENYVYSLSNLADIQQYHGDYIGSEATITESIPFLKNIKKQRYAWNVYVILGNNYLNTFDYDNALYYYNKALYLKTSKWRKTRIKNNIALVYIEQTKYQDAVQILYPLTLKKEVLDDTETYSRILDNLGYCYYKLENPEALDYLNRSKKIRTQIKDDWGMIASYYHLSEYYKKSNSNLATDYARLTYEKATKINSVDDRLRTLELLIRNSTGNKSKKYSLDYIRINDSINKVRQKAKNQFAKIKYDSKKDKIENLELKSQKVAYALQLEQQKNKNLLLFLIVGIIIAFAGFIYYYLVTKHKRENIKTSYNTEVRISKKLHDELANDVYQTMVFAETQDLATVDNKEILIGNLDNIYSRTRNISRKNSTIETGLSFIPNLKEMMSGFNTTSIHVLINGLDIINWSAVEDTKKITVYRILQELLVNMKKHSKSSLVVISFKTNDTKIQIDYSDNGVGATSEEINFKKGLQNVENRILAIKGSIIFDTKSGKGFKVNILFPK